MAIVGRRRAPPALRGRHLMIADAIATVSAFVFSLALRFDGPSPQLDKYLNAYGWFIPVLVVCRLGGFLYVRLYTRVWRYASIGELVSVVASVSGSSLVAYTLLYAAVAFTPFLGLGFPRSVAIVDTVLVIGLAGAWRFAFRVFGVGRSGSGAGERAERAIVVGGGTAAMAVLREVAANGELGFRPVGVVADDIPSGQRIMGVPALGPLTTLAANVKKHSVSVVLLALPSADGRVLRRLVHEAEAAGARSLTVPSVAEVVAGRVTVNALRDIEIEDLLRRAPPRIDHEGVSRWLRGRSVLITGAGGSIGSELARQVIRFDPGRLILLGRGENSIFEAMESLRGVAEATDIVPLIQDVRDRTGVERMFATMRPDVVLHAAAHKHVTFMELFPEEAVAVNIFGTSNLLDSAARHGTESFVFISTDKAVNPTSVMGASKRVSELLVRQTAVRTGRNYATVRFGNVLGSRGSVVPLFRRQLAAGGPLTVTDPDATRYFMTIPEAVQLVLQASVLAQPGDTFVLDMGDPVRITQLAQDLVELHGMELGKDIELSFFGLRSGEKLVEELYFADERPRATTHEAIRRIAHSNPVGPIELNALVSQLVELAAGGDRRAIVNALKVIVPEFRSTAECSLETPDVRTRR